MIEINLGGLQKGERRIKVKATSKRKEHYRTIKGDKKDQKYDSGEITPSEIKSIQAWSARGGEMASKFVWDSENREILMNHLETAKPNAEGKMIHRGIGLTEREWEERFETWTEPGTIIKNDRISSFTLDRKRAPIHCTGEQGIILSIKNKSGIDISDHSIYPEEAEVLTRRDFSWKVISADIAYGSTWEIIGEEI